MSEFLIEGGHKLSGEIIPQGAKNEALQVLSAVLLTDQPVTISNLPDIRDTQRYRDILSLLGVKITKHNKDTFTFQADNVNLDMLLTKEFTKLSTSIRASIMVLGPLLGRFHKAYAARPGGDQIGRRPLNTHFEGLEKLGAKVSISEDGNFFEAQCDQLRGTYILLPEASVTGTANVVMAAVLAEGETTIFNAACEPYLYQLCTMLNKMGARIEGVGSNLLRIQGVEKLNGCEHRILPDMIEIGSFIGMAALTQSSLTIKDCAVQHLGIIPDTFRKLGIDFDIQGDDIVIHEQDCYEVETNMDGSILTIADAPWPGFTPDLISIALVTAIQARGSVLIHQKMFESRLFFVDKLQSMGAQITLCDPHRAIVIGLQRRKQLRATVMASPDIRAGVALLIAALSAKGKSIIQNVEQIDRGYQHIVERLNALGACIERVGG
ncbi:MAG: UDP-N-acetylglucosamine 1-carboxyvinyltransferase [Bacteroidales bacterium]|nr:UDP-N-acetylglucosamine 1-carboxyvinyltransferase [Bacteroidales bacterium]